MAKSQFRARNARWLIFALCRQRAARRNDVSASAVAFSRYNVRNWEADRCRNDMAQCGRFSRFALLCTAFSMVALAGAGRPLGGDHRARQGACHRRPTARVAIPPIPPNHSPVASASTPRFGAIYSPNLTPDRETGIGGWSDEDFVRALRNGVAPDGSRYYPAFPYPYFTKLTRQDLLAIRAYLATLAPFSNPRPAAGTALAAELSRADAGLGLSVLPAGHIRAEPAEKSRSGIAAAIWSRASRIAARATRRKTCSAPTSAAAPLAAAWCRAGSRHASTAPSAAG